MIDRIHRWWRMHRRDGVRAMANDAVQKLSALLNIPTAARRAYDQRKAADDAAFDQHGGTDTGGVQQLSKLTIAGGNAHHGFNHLAVTWPEFDGALAVIDADFPEPSEVTFIDLGSGKGRSLLMAAERGFKHVVGVEFATELDEAARRNVAGRADHDRFTVIHGDAVEYELPPGPVLLYLFNPFDETLMAEVARRTTASWRADERPMRVAYLHPTSAEVWRREGWREVGSMIGCYIFAPPERAAG